MIRYGIAEGSWFAALGLAPSALADKGCVCNCFLITQFKQYFKFVNMNLSALVHLESLLNWSLTVRFATLSWSMAYATSKVLS